MREIAAERDLVWYAGLFAVSIVVGLLAGLDPRLAVAASLGLAFVLIVMANITLGLCIFILIAFTGFLPALDGTVGLVKVAGLLLVLSWLAVIATREGSRINFFAAQPALAYLLLVFLGWIGLSLLWAESADAGFSAFFRYTLSLLLFPIVYTAVQSQKHVVWVIGSFVAGAVAASVVGLANPPTDPFIGGRLSGVLLDPNELAAVLVAGTILAGALAVIYRRSHGIFLLGLGAMLLCATALVMTQSRGGFVAVIFVLVIGPLVAGKWWKQVAVGALAVALSIAILFSALAPQGGSERVTTLGSGTGRTDIWKVGWRMVEDKPALGVGAGNFQNSSIHYLLAPGVIQSDDFFVDQPKAAHNTYLQVLAELGAVGFTLFVLILVAFVICAILAARTFGRYGNWRMEVLSRALIVAVFGLLAADFFISGQFSKQLWLLLALGPALLGVARSSDPTTQH